MRYKTFLKLKWLDAETLRMVINPINIYYDDNFQYWTMDNGFCVIKGSILSCPVDLLRWIHANNGKDGININLRP